MPDQATRGRHGSAASEPAEDRHDDQEPDDEAQGHVPGRARRATHVRKLWARLRSGDAQRGITSEKRLFAEGPGQQTWDVLALLSVASLPREKEPSHLLHAKVGARRAVASRGRRLSAARAPPRSAPR